MTVMNNYSSNIRENARKKVMQELKEYRNELLKRAEQEKNNDSVSGEKGHSKTLGTHPGTGNFYNHSHDMNEEEKFTSYNGFINQFLMVLIVFCFLFTMYMISAFILL